MLPQTITFYRFLGAFVLALFFMFLTKKPIPILQKKVAKNDIVLILLSILGAAGCEVMFAAGMIYVSPEISQVIWQFGPLLLLIGSVIFFKEKFSLLQVISISLVFVFSILFFTHGINDFSIHIQQYARGIIFLSITVVLWAIYGLTQKPLIVRGYTCCDIVFFLSLGSAVVLFPFAHIGEISVLKSNNILLLSNFIFVIFGLFASVVLFAQSFKHWEAYKSSIIVMILPVITLLSVIFFHWLIPHFVARPNLNSNGIILSFVIVFFSILAIASLEPKAYKAIIKENYDKNAE